MGQDNQKNGINPRWKTGRRKTYQQRFRAMNLPCALCGRPIDYSLPYYVTDEQGKKHINMWAFVIDEIKPVSKWQQFGYTSPAECANDYNNLQPAHAICNQMKSNKTTFSLQEKEKPKRKRIALDGKW